MKPFSIRHRKALLEKRLKVSLSGRLRRRITLLLGQYDHSVSVQRDPGDSWVDNSNVLCEVERELKRIYGQDPLVVSEDYESLKQVEADLKTFIQKTYPSQVLDVIEVFCDQLEYQKDEFPRRINEAFEQEDCPWRMADGQFFKVDSGYLEAELLARAQDVLKAEGFEGALDEFKKARNALTSGEIKDAIHKACQSFESTLTTITGEKKPAGDLIEEFVKAGYCEDLPADARKAFAKNVLPALAVMRNKLGGHGQGEDVVEVPKAYGQLAVHLAAALNHFATQKHIERKPKPEPKEEVQTVRDESLPF